MLRLFSGISVIVVLACYALGVYYFITKLGIGDWVENLLDFLPYGQVWDVIGLVLYLIIVLVIPLVIFLAALFGKDSL